MTTLVTANEITKKFGKKSSELEFEFLNNFESTHTKKAYKRDIIFFLDSLKQS
jgi:hypothetical protein